MQEQKGEFLTKEEYNKIPVYYCKHCGSLAIMTMPENPDDYCDKCGSTDIGKASIEGWLHLQSTFFKKIDEDKIQKKFNYLKKTNYGRREEKTDL